MLIAIVACYYCRDESNKEANLINGAKCATIFYFLLGLLIFPQGPFERPHPIVRSFGEIENQTNLNSLHSWVEET